MNALYKNLSNNFIQKNTDWLGIFLPKGCKMDFFLLMKIIYEISWTRGKKIVLSNIFWLSSHFYDQSSFPPNIFVYFRSIELHNFIWRWLYGCELRQKIASQWEIWWFSHRMHNMILFFSFQLTLGFDY